MSGTIGDERVALNGATSADGGGRASGEKTAGSGAIINEKTVARIETMARAIRLGDDGWEERMQRVAIIVGESALKRDALPTAKEARKSAEAVCLMLSATLELALSGGAELERSVKDEARCLMATLQTEVVLRLATGASSRALPAFFSARRAPPSLLRRLLGAIARSITGRNWS